MSGDSERFDPNYNDEVEPMKATEAATLSAVEKKLGDLQRTLPKIEINARFSQKLDILHEEVKGSLARVRAEIQRARLGSIDE